MKYKFIRLLLLFLVSCTQTSRDQEIISDLSSQMINLSNFEVLEIQYIPFIGSIDQWNIGEKGFTFLVGSTLYHYPQSDTEPFVLDSDTYLELSGCTPRNFSISGNRIFILCDGKGIVHEFNLQEGSYVASMDLGVDASRIEVLQDRIYLYQTPNTLNQDPALNYQIFTFPLSNQDERKKYFPYSASTTNSYQFNILVNQAFANTGNELIFSRMLNDTLVKFDNAGNLIGAERLHVLSEEIDAQVEVEVDEEKLYFPLYLSQSPEWRFFSLIKNYSLQTLVHHLPTGKKILVDKVRLSDDIQLPFLAQVYQDHVYLLFTDEAFIELNKNKSYPEPFQKLKSYEIPFLFIRFPLSELPY
ncbi:MAG: hypothetical protein ACXIT9_02520 [Nitritalea sp.]